MDAKYIISGSDEGNVRVWFANASERSKVLTPREKQKRDYGDALKEQFKHMPEIRRISRQRHVPKAIKKAAETKRIGLESINRREDNRRKHSKPGTVPYVPERKSHIVAQKQ
jgi:DDB1- and CUL4-associated factor 13